MRAVLGIDAAWTLTQPSDAAVAAEFRDGWHLIAPSACRIANIAFNDAMILSYDANPGLNGEAKTASMKHISAIMVR
jgi:hypothetical protein